jgi:hypothetical protein
VRPVRRVPCPMGRDLRREKEGDGPVNWGHHRSRIERRVERKAIDCLYQTKEFPEEIADEECIGEDECPNRNSFDADLDLCRFLNPGSACCLDMSLAHHTPLSNPFNLAGGSLRPLSLQNQRSRSDR